jgi:hypothetical protein
VNIPSADDNTVVFGIAVFADGAANVILAVSIVVQSAEIAAGNFYSIIDNRTVFAYTPGNDPDDSPALYLYRVISNRIRFGTAESWAVDRKRPPKRQCVSPACLSPPLRHSRLYNFYKKKLYNLPKREYCNPD